MGRSANAADKIVQAKHLYLNLTFFAHPLADLRRGLGPDYGRRGLISGPAFEDETKSWKYSSALEAERARYHAAYFFTITFRAVDYLMSLDVTWADHLRISGGGGTGFIGDGDDGLVPSAGDAPVDPAITARHCDLGKLMLAMVMMWAYLSFSQYLIIYSEICRRRSWYRAALVSGWQWNDGVIYSISLPFGLLLSQTLKKNPRHFGDLVHNVLHSSGRRVLAGGARLRRCEPSRLHDFVAHSIHRSGLADCG